MGNNISVCEPNLDRESYFPGNNIAGHVRVVADDEKIIFFAVRLYIEGVAWYRWESGSGKHRHTHVSKNVFSKTVITVAGDAENSSGKNKYTLTKGQHIFPFSAVLSPATLPTASVSCGSTRARVYWQVSSVIDVAGRLNQAGSKEFMVFSPISQQLWSQPSAKQESYNQPVTCCCCCSKGEISATCSVSKTVVSLDRDTIDWTCEVDNTRGDEAIEAITGCMTIQVLPKLGPTHLRPSETHFPNRVPVNIPAGQRGQAQGRIQLAPGAPASISSAVVDYNWVFSAVVEVEGCCTANPRLSIPVQVAHFVDQSNTAAQYIQQQQQSFQPIMDAQMLNQAGMWEVPNMAAQNSPAFGQLPPAPPPQQNWAPPQGYGGGNNDYQYNNNNNNNYDANMATGMPPPPPGQGGFPGFATFPEGEYFVKSSQSGQFGPEK